MILLDLVFDSRSRFQSTIFQVIFEVFQLLTEFMPEMYTLELIPTLEVTQLLSEFIFLTFTRSQMVTDFICI